VFNSDNTYTVTSLDEVSSGEYTFTAEANASNRHAFSFNVSSDNQQFDCEANNDDDTGTVYNLYVEFPDANVMNWYLDATGGAAVVTLNRV